MKTETKKIMKKNYLILGVFLVIVALAMVSCVGEDKSPLYDEWEQQESVVNTGNSVN